MNAATMINDRVSIRRNACTRCYHVHFKTHDGLWHNYLGGYVAQTDAFSEVCGPDFVAEADRFYAAHPEFLVHGTNEIEG